MSREYYEKKSSGGLMDEIQALIAPPGEERKKREGLDLHPYFRRPGRGHNHDKCDACGEGGDLLCCDRCPASFHLGCHDPPIPEEEIPSGDWICHNCKATEALKQGAAHMAVPRQRVHCSEALAVRSPLQQLIQAASLLNPKQFELPPEMAVNDVLPGQVKPVQKGSGNRKKPYELDNGLVPLPAKLCFKCNKSCRVAPLVACDYCSACFHMDCLDPPMTTMPSGSVWMCPLHVENFLDSSLLTSSRLTERLKLWNQFSGPIDQDMVKLNFLKRVHRKHPPFRRKIRIENENLVEVPEAVKSHYRNPPPLPVDIARGANIWSSSSTSAGASEEEQELWLKSVLSMQLAITQEMSQRTMSSADVEVKQEPKTERHDEQTENMDADEFVESKIEITTNGICEHESLENTEHTSEPRHAQPEPAPRVVSDVTQSAAGPDWLEEQHLRAHLAAAGSLDLDVLDDRLVRLLAVQRLQQLMGDKTVCQLTPRAELDRQKCAGSLVTPRAALTPLAGLGGTEYLRYRTARLGSGAQNDINLDAHGFCRYVSGEHATIFFDDFSRRFELLNYSEHGTVVDGVLYACDFTRDTVTGAGAESEVEATVRRIAEKQRLLSDADDVGVTMSRQPCLEQRRCRCICPLSGSPAAPLRGFEGPAPLQHGSLVQLGCLKFVLAELPVMRPPKQESVVEMLEERRQHRHDGEKGKHSDDSAVVSDRDRAMPPNTC